MNVLLFIYGPNNKRRKLHWNVLFFPIVLFEWYCGKDFAGRNNVRVARSVCYVNRRVGDCGAKVQEDQDAEKTFFVIS